MLGFVRFFTFERQLILFAICLAGTVLLWSTVGIAWAWMPLLVVIILLVKHLLIGTVNQSAMRMQMGRWDSAEQVLKYTIRPSWLRFGYHGMYYILKSRMALQKGENRKGEALANKALSLNLQDDFKAMVYLQLISIYGNYQKNNPKNKSFMMKIKEYLQKAKKLRVSNIEIKQNIKEVEMMLKGQHQTQKKMMSGGKGGMKSAMNQGYMKRGGGRKKRR